MNIRTFFRLGIFLLLAFLFSTTAFSQCSNFIKNKCGSKLKPYLSTGQIYNTTLLSEDRTELTMTFYSGHSYRIIVCSEAALGKVQFRLKDANNNILFSNKGYGNLWDFNIQTTQELTIEVITPPSDKEIDESGCVAILVGFKQQ